MPETGQLEKLFRSTEELVEAEEAHVNGQLPDWLQGTFIRVGPGKWDFHGFSMNHWLDGFSLLSKFVINGDRIHFQKLFLQSEAYKRAMAAKKPVFYEYGTQAYADPNKGLFSRLANMLLPFELTDNDTLSLFKLGNDVFASSETNYFRQINPCSLHSGDRFDTNKCFGLNVSSAHPLTDPETGITYQLGSTLLTGFKYTFVKIPPPTSPNQSSKDFLKKSKTMCSIPSSVTGCLSFHHSFGMTQNYLIFIEQPYMMNITRALSTFVKGTQTFKDWLEWRPEFLNRFYLVDKKTGKVLKTEYISDKPFFFLHIINAYEESGQIVIDINAYQNVNVFESMYLSKLRTDDVHVDDDASPCAERYIIPIIHDGDDHIKNYECGRNLIEGVKSGAVAVRDEDRIVLTSEILSERGFELPMINPKFASKKYTYIYATGSASEGYFRNAIGKIDVKKKEALLWREKLTYYPGEPMFVPNPNPNKINTDAGAEDNGVIMSAVTDTMNNANDFIIFLDAKSMKEIGRAYFKSHVPQALHGIFLPNLV